jgi:hypothetical protein
VRFALFYHSLGDHDARVFEAAASLVADHEESAIEAFHAGYPGLASRSTFSRS